MIGAVAPFTVIKGGRRPKRRRSSGARAETSPRLQRLTERLAVLEAEQPIVVDAIE